MSALWRPEDEALLGRLEDELIFAQLWRAMADGAAPPHRRAAGLVAVLRRRVEPGVLEAAARGELAPLTKVVNAPDPATLTGPLAHHLALFHGRLADARERSDDAAQRGSAEWPRLRSIGMWLWLAEERTYLRRFTAEVVAGGLPPDEVQRLAIEAPYEGIAQLGARARGGARELSDRARAALRVLARVDQAAKLGGVGDAVRTEAERRAQRARAAAIDDAIARVDDAVEEARGREAQTDELIALFADAAAIWRWSDRAEQVEHFLVERITPFCWERYREKRWDELRSLLRPSTELVNHLSERIERDPTQIAYAGPCAQMYVFRAEVAGTFDQQLQSAERAVVLCPTHRNGRLVLADLLVERGLRALDRARPWETGDALNAAARDVRRAAELFPMLSRLADAKQRLKALGRDLDAA